MCSSVETQIRISLGVVKQFNKDETCRYTLDYMSFCHGGGLGVTDC